MTHSRRRFAHSIACVLAVVALVHTALADGIRTVALRGQQAPGAPGGVTFNSFNPPVLNAAGDTAFVAGLTGGGADSTNNTGIWSEGSGSLDLVARKGDQAADTPTGANYNFFQTPLLNEAGQIAFRASLTGSGVFAENDQGIWSGPSENLALVAREGDRAPDTPDTVTFIGFGFDSPLLNSTGQTALHGSLVGSGVNSTNNRGIWSGGSDSLALVARNGSQAPGTPIGTNYSGFNSFALNGAGLTAFHATLTGGVNVTNDSGIWSEGSGSLALVAREGDHAPGTPDGVNFSSFSYPAPALNSAGQVAFRATLTGAGVVGTNSQGIWSGTSDHLELVARSGDQAPGTPGGVNFSSVSSPALNAAGQTAFSAGLTGTGVDGTNNQGIWSEGSGSLELVARAGSHAPGTPEGVNFRSMFYTTLTMNAAGQTAFLADVTNGQPGSPDRGIWATDVNGTLQLIVRKGDVLEVAPSDFRTISSLSVVAIPKEQGTGNEDGRPSGFNDRGQLAFMAIFTDGASGVFVSDAVLNDGALPGDFNGDGVVDSSDFIVWRQTDGDNRAGYNIWRANFGRTASGSGAEGTAPVPEPSAILLAVIALLAPLSAIRSRFDVHTRAAV